MGVIELRCSPVLLAAGGRLIDCVLEGGRNDRTMPLRVPFNGLLQGTATPTPSAAPAILQRGPTYCTGD